MDHQAIVETVFKAVITALPNELGALLGQELSCSDAVCTIASDESLITKAARPKSTLAHLKVTGDHEGEAFLILPTKTSIIFGGTLIMLPQDQIEENASKEQLDGEVADAYGEVANILAGVLTQIFLDKYPKSMRFVRTEVEELGNANQDAASEKPIPPGNYFHLSTELDMGGQNLGKLEIITPAILLDLEEAEASAPDDSDSIESTSEETSQVAAPEAAEPQPEEPEQAAAPEPAPAAEPPAAPTRPPFADTKKVADVVLKATIEQVTEEVGALLGQSFGYSDLKLEMVTKSEFFDSHCTDKSVLSYMDVTGDCSGKIYLINLLKDATLMGGTLIMLPEEEIASHISSGEFDGEVADAYGEVANIISGGLTQTFQDRFPQPLRFVKTTEETIVPTKISSEGDTPFPEGLYYLASCAISLQDKPLDKMHLLFPAEILGLENYAEDSAQASAPASEAVQTASNETTQAQASAPASAPAARPATPPPADAPPVLLVIADTQDDADSFNRNLNNDNYEIKVIGYKDDVREIFSANPVIGIFLLMSEVGEKGFSVAIKLQSCGYSLPPVIACGPEWTRSAVLKAVKYGARDILVTPASDDEIMEKANQHITASA